MTLYELVNNTTVQSDILIRHFGKDGYEDGTFLATHVEDLAGANYPERWEDCEVKYIYLNGCDELVIEVYEEE